MLRSSERSNYVIIDLIGNIPDENENTNKIDTYYQITNGILIKYLATDFLKIYPERVKILAYSSKQFYNKFIHMSNKCYFQLGIHNIFEIDSKPIQIDFNYFDDFNLILSNFETILQHNEGKKVILFLDNHGSKGFFSDIDYFRLYKILMKFPNNQFLIFNDSCFSGSMINLVESYEQLYILKTKNEIKEDLCPQVLFSFFNLFQFLIYEKNVKISNDLINNVIDLINFYQTIDINDDNMIEKVINFKDQSDDKSGFINEIQKFGFSNVDDITKFQMILDSIELTKSEDNRLKYKNSKNIFTKSNLNTIIKLAKENVQSFIEILRILYVSKEFIDFKLKPHQNIEIITSTDDKKASFSFANKVTKIYPGSPAMSSFIKEVFLKGDDSPINFQNIQKEISGYDRTLIYFPIRDVNNDGTILTPRKKMWKHLNPKHYKQTKSDFSFSLDSDVKKRVAALRKISALNINILKDVAYSLNLNIYSNEKQPIHLNSRNDYDADIIIIIAILLNNKCENPTNLLIDSIDEIFLFHQSDSLIQTMLLIIEFSFNLSKSPIIMSATVLNCLHLAIKKVIFRKLILFSQENQSVNNLKYLFLIEEISSFSIKKSETSFENENDLYNIINSSSNNDEFQFINDIDNIIISLLNDKSVFYGVIIASILLGNKDYKKIKDYEKQINKIEDDNQANESFLPDESTNDPNINKQIKEKAEYYLLYHIESSFIYLDCICNLQIKNDSMRYVSRQLQYISAISIIRMLIESLDAANVESLVKNIIDPIESLISSRNISSFFIPSILSILPINLVFNALYITVSNAKGNWYNEVIDLIKKIKSCDLDDEVFDQIIELAKNYLKNQENICTKSKYQEEIDSMKKEISKEIEKALDKILRLIQISTKRARENISRNMSVNLLLDQVEEYKSFIMAIETKQYNNKFHKYLDSSISELLEATELNNNSYVNSVPNIGFDANNSLTNTDDLLKRVANELNTVIHIFNISDNSYYKSKDNEPKIINSDDILNCSFMIIVARILNISEMNPVTNLIKLNKNKFNEFDGKNPNIKELMGLITARIHIISDKDKKRRRFKLREKEEKETIEFPKQTFEEEEEKKSTEFPKQTFEEQEEKTSTELQKKQFEEEEEIDSYYSIDYIEENELFPYRTIQTESTKVKLHSNKIFASPFSKKTKFYKDQISLAEVERIRKIANLGPNLWVEEAWIAFLYCFNNRMKNIDLHFDIKNDYKDANYPIHIDPAICIVRHFYPIGRIIKFWEHKDQFDWFLGKNRTLIKDIYRAFIRAFDDADRIVTPLHMPIETYYKRTPEKLKLVFESYI